MHEERRPGADAGEVGGDGLSGDAHAVQWYAKAGDQGHADALYRLGCMYIDDGRGVRELAASLGMADQVTEGQLHLQALAAFMLAGSQGHEAAQEIVHRLRPTTPGGETVDIPTLRRQHGAAAVSTAARGEAAATGAPFASSTSPFSQGADASAAATLSIAQVTLALAQAAEAAAAETGSSTCDEIREGGGGSLDEAAAAGDEGFPTDKLTGQQREKIESKAAAATTRTTTTTNRGKKKKGGKQRKK